MKIKYHIDELCLRTNNVPREILNRFLKIQKCLFKCIDRNVIIYFDDYSNSFFPVIYLESNKYYIERTINISKKLYRRYLVILELIDPFVCKSHI